MKKSPRQRTQPAGALTTRILENIRLRFFQSDLSQREVETRLGFARGYLSRLLTGVVEIKYWQLLAILHAMDLEPADFFAELFPRRRHPALEALEDHRRRARGRPLSRELARLFAFGIESILDLYQRLERCEAALDDLVDLGILEPRAQRRLRKIGKEWK